MSTIIATCKCGDSVEATFSEHPNLFIEVFCLHCGQFPADGSGLLRAEARVEKIIEAAFKEKPTCLDKAHDDRWCAG